MSKRMLGWVAAAGLVFGAFSLSCGGKSSSPTSPGGVELNSGSIASGTTFSHTFAAPGVYPYHCTVPGHGIMTGTVTVNTGGSTADTTITIVGIAPFPAVTLTVGGNLHWHNTSGLAHTVTSN